MCRILFNLLEAHASDQWILHHVVKSKFFRLLYLSCCSVCKVCCNHL